jgi:hypothetical protein
MISVTGGDTSHGIRNAKIRLGYIDFNNIPLYSHLNSPQILKLIHPFETDPNVFCLDQAEFLGGVLKIS